MLGDWSLLGVNDGEQEFSAFYWVDRACVLVVYYLTFQMIPPFGDCTIKVSTPVDNSKDYIQESRAKLSHLYTPLNSHHAMSHLGCTS